MRMPQSKVLQLQVGGAINPRTSVYIVRSSDDELLYLLEKGMYCNVLCSRQTGKTSLLKRTKVRLEERGYATVDIDISGYLGSPQDADIWYQGLLQGIAQQLRLQIDVPAWWRMCAAVTPNQRLIQFFHDEVIRKIQSPIVIFIDEIDSTLKLPYTDDMFVAFRSMFNDRVSEPEYERISFCLVGVATPNELIKDCHTTPYNIGKTIELQDFNYQQDDLNPLIHAVSNNVCVGLSVVKQILSWTGGHPYLTLRVCEEFIKQSKNSPEEVESLIKQTFDSIESLRTDIHFDQVLRFLNERTDTNMTMLNLYRRIWNCEQVYDQTSSEHLALKLSGIVKRSKSGQLVLRNTIYRDIFNNEWIRSVVEINEKQRDQAVARQIAAEHAEQILRRGIEDYQKASGAYQNLCDNPVYRGNPRELWASFLNRLALRAEHFQNRDEALLWRLKALDVFHTDDCEKSVRNLIGMDYPFLMVTLRHTSGVKLASFSRNNEMVFTASINGVVQAWQLRTARPVGAPIHHQGAVRAVAFSLDGDKIFTASVGAEAQVFLVESGEPVGRSIQQNKSEVRSAVFSPDGSKIVTGNVDGTARIWDIETGEPIGITMDHQGIVWSVSFSPDGQKVLTGSIDGIARVWDANTGEPISKPMRHQGSVWSAAFSSDGEKVITGSKNGTVELWQAATGESISKLMQHKNTVSAVAFSPDNKWICTGSLDGMARIWETETGQLNGYPICHPRPIEAVDFSSDGHMILTGSDDGTARIWSFVSDLMYNEFSLSSQDHATNLLEAWQRKLGLRINEAGKVEPT